MQGDLFDPAPAPPVPEPFEIRVGHCLELLRAMPDESVQCCVTSPPYWGLRDYGDPGQAWPAVSYRPLPGMTEIDVPEQVAALGLEPEPYHYVAHLVAVFREVRRVLRADGTLWLNLGDTWSNIPGGQNGSGFDPGQKRLDGTHCAMDASRRVARKRRSSGVKDKNLVGIPWLVAFALRTDGWYLRSDVIWHKPNPMPESVRDRPTKAHEYLFLLSKSSQYAYDANAVREPHSRHWWKERVGQPYMSKQDGRNDGGKRQGNGDPRGRNKRSVWTVTPRPYKGAHFAVMPPDLIEPCVLAGCPDGGLVLDPFSGAGTVGVVALRHGRRFLGLEQSEAYAHMAMERVREDVRKRAAAPRRA